MVRSTSQLPGKPSLDTLEQVLPLNPAVLRGYAKGVADELARGPLTLDRRDRLLGRAQHLGLGRFEAALVIAVAERQPAATGVIHQPAERTRFLPLLGVAAALQATLIAAAWWMVA